MDKWTLIGPTALIKNEQQESVVLEGQVKVKITNVMLTAFDSLIYGGVIQTNFPTTPGRCAVGIITEVGANCYGVAVGDRVYMQAAKCCGECFACKSGNEENCTEIKIAGRDFDGFLRDFVVCDYSEVYVLPDSVDDFHALCVEYVALAQSIYDRLNLVPGQRVAVIGGRLLGNVISQVLQYHKVIPLVIDNNKNNREMAQKTGAYYAFSADDDLIKNVEEATCGHMCDAAIYNTSSRISPSVATSIVANNREIVLGGFSNVNFNINAHDIVDKQLSLYGLSNGYGYISTAINMLVHGAVKIDVFDKQVLTDFDPVEYFKAKFADAQTSNYPGMIIFKMII